MTRQHNSGERVGDVQAPETVGNDLRLTASTCVLGEADARREVEVVAAGLHDPFGYRQRR
ncbi:MAG: hypothetical protein QM714_02295 [Nocardioides sp.]